MNSIDTNGSNNINSKLYQNIQQNIKNFTKLFTEVFIFFNDWCPSFQVSLFNKTFLILEVEFNVFFPRQCFCLSVQSIVILFNVMPTLTFLCLLQEIYLEFFIAFVKHLLVKLQLSAPICIFVFLVVKVKKW